MLKTENPKPTVPVYSGPSEKKKSANRRKSKFRSSKGEHKTQTMLDKMGQGSDKLTSEQKLSQMKVRTTIFLRSLSCLILNPPNLDTLTGEHRGLPQ